MESTEAMTKAVIMDRPDRSSLKLEEQIKESFIFLVDLGFSEIEALPTLVRYQNGDIEVDIYHGRQSYEIGAGVTVFGVRYSIARIIEASDPEAYKQFRYAMTTTPEGVSVAIKELSSLLKRYGNEVLRGDLQFITTLDKQGEQNAEKLALDSLAYQLRPKANEAFRQKDYSTAADLYSRIRKCLSAAELNKLSFAIKHSKTVQS